MQGTISERRVLLLIGAVQFVNVLDFMMVLPLGPDFARALGIPTSRLGLVGAAYTAAAALSGALGAFVLDRFDRRRALGVTLSGLAIGTVVGALATDLASMLAARVVAGAFGGPTTALSLAVISDVVPAHRRGRAMGAVMGAFSVASVLGVPAGLELARAGGWRLPFVAVAVLGAALAATAVLVLPPLDRHLRAAPVAPARAIEIDGRPAAWLALVATAALMTAQFAIVPNIPAYWQFNLGYPRERLGLLFVAGGAVSFATMRLAGRLADRAGAAVTAAAATALYVVVLFAAFIVPSREPPAVALFVAFMAASSARMVPIQTLSSRVPAPARRARFMSAQSVVQHLGSATGALLASRMLHDVRGGALGGMERVAWLAVPLAAAVPGLLWAVEARVRRRERRLAPADDDRVGRARVTARVRSASPGAAAHPCTPRVQLRAMRAAAPPDSHEGRADPDPARAARRRGRHMSKASRIPRTAATRRWQLAENATMRVPAGRSASAVRVERGTVLVTQEGDRDDHVLEAGDEIVLRAGGLAVAWAFTDATVSIRRGARPAPGGDALPRARTA